MTAAPALLARLVVVGANHRSSPLALRDQLFFDDEALPGFLAGLAARGVGQALALSTCDRVEVVAAHPDPDLAERAIREAFAERAGRAPAELAAQLYTLSGVEAVRHCFAVTASLDSQIIGEPHVLGQVKAAHRLCRLGGGEVEALLQAAYATAKRVRAETTVAEGPVSIASAAVRVACDLHGDLRRCEALLIGAGEMGELVAESLLAAGLNRLLITAPRASRAETLARALGCATLPFADFGPALAEADIVLTSIGGRHTVIAADAVQAALKKRRRKPIFLVDAGIPGDIAPAVNRVEGAFLYDIGDLEGIAMAGRATREAAAEAAWRIVDAEVEAFVRCRAARAAVPAIVALRGQVEALRQQALAEAGGDAEAATRALTQRLLHDPSEVMRDIAGGGDPAEWEMAERLLRRLFRL